MTPEIDDVDWYVCVRMLCNFFNQKMPFQRNPSSPNFVSRKRRTAPLLAMAVAAMAASPTALGILLTFYVPSCRSLLFKEEKRRQRSFSAECYPIVC